LRLPNFHTPRQAYGRQGFRKRGIEDNSHNANLGALESADIFQTAPIRRVTQFSMRQPIQSAVTLPTS
jgi:hypothetical protein